MKFNKKYLVISIFVIFIIVLALSVVVFSNEEIKCRITRDGFNVGWTQIDKEVFLKFIQSNISKKECKKVGGSWSNFGWDRVCTCVAPAPDKDKPCEDGAECLSKLCMYDKELTKESFPDSSLTDGAPAKGKCSGWWSQRNGPCPPDHVEKGVYRQKNCIE